MAGSLTVLSAHRFGRAREELQTAELLLKNANFRSSINRSYYAIFHAIRAVNALDGFDSSKHSGVISHFNQEYVKTGIFEREASKIIRNASELREQADYEDFRSASLLRWRATCGSRRFYKVWTTPDYYLTTTAKKPVGLAAQGLRAFLINHRKFVQYPPNPCGTTVCGLTA